MKKVMILIGLLGVVARLHAQDPWVQGFNFKTQQIGVDVHGQADSYVERTSAMSQWDKHRNQDEEYVDQAALKELSAHQMQKFNADQDNQFNLRQSVILEQEAKPTQLSLLAQCQQFFMNIFAFLYKK